jgi:hypothetical protein
MKPHVLSDAKLELLMYRSGLSVPEADKAQVFQAMRALKELAAELAAWNKT